MTIVSFHSLCTQLQSLASFAEYGKRKECVYLGNACTLVPTVFLRHDKTEFKRQALLFVYPRRGKWDFTFLFSFSQTNWNFYFRFSFFFYFLQQNCNCHFRFASSVLVWHKRNLNFGFRLSFSCFIMLFQDIYRRKLTIEESDVSATSWRHCQGKVNQKCDYESN